MNNRLQGVDPPPTKKTHKQDHEEHNVPQALDELGLCFLRGPPPPTRSTERASRGVGGRPGLIHLVGDQDEFIWGCAIWGEGILNLNDVHESVLNFFIQIHAHMGLALFELVVAQCPFLVVLKQRPKGNVHHRTHFAQVTAAFRLRPGGDRVQEPRGAQREGDELVFFCHVPGRRSGKGSVSTRRISAINGQWFAPSAKVF